MDEDNCMVDIAKFFLEFTKDESCGKCTPAVSERQGFWNILKITEGKATMQDLEDMEELCYYIRTTRFAVWDKRRPTPCFPP